MIDLIFIILTFLLAYIYCGYPVLLFLVAKILPRRHRYDEQHEPAVTLIISAHNEEDIIEAKLRNAFEMDYPPEKLTIMVVSDGSTDKTDEIVGSFAHQGVVLIRPAERRGKTAGLNLALAGVKSELVVFSDANAMYDRFAIRKLVRHFVDDKIGYVVGHARYENTKETTAGSNEGSYWNVEVKMKEWESAFSSVVGGDGAIYAIRSRLYELLQESDINDFVNPLQIVAKGYRGIFDREAWCVEKPAGIFEKEFNRKVRIANRSFNGFLRVPKACNPLKEGRFAWQLVSHKLLRWFSPFILSLHFIASLAAAGTRGFVDLVAFCFILIYGFFAVFGLIGWYMDKNGRPGRIFSFSYYFVLMNVALAEGILLRLRGTIISIWETVREQSMRQNLSSSILTIFLVGVVLAVMIRVLLIQESYHHFIQLMEYALLGILFYTYLGYPLLIALLAKVVPVHVKIDTGFLPFVTLLIIAYNEETEIEAKLKNSLALEYPHDKLRIIVASDGSTDHTNEIVEKYRDRIELLAFSPNRGKVAALNDAMLQVKTGIVVFSDANVMYASDSVLKLVRNFNDPRVGAVSGRVRLINDTVSYRESEKHYYSIEHFIQAKEGETGAMVGTDGAMYAIRRDLFQAPPPDTILDDFVISMKIAINGYLVIHEREAVGWEFNHLEVLGEFRRKARIIAGGFQCLLSREIVPLPSQPLLLFKFLSHKVLRWFSGLMFTVLFCVLLQSWLVGSHFSIFMAIVLFGMMGMLCVTILTYLLPILRKITLVSMVYYFIMITGASLVGLYRGLTGTQRVTWRHRVQDKCVE
jgi:cellulose synthase/poly-beta-1,6-N-acetylglucosamine synthase-like glycosyltransferase